MNMKRIEKLIEALQRDLVAAKLQHIQLLLGALNGELVVRFVSVDTDRLRDGLKAITDRYCESLALVRETKTTYVFAI